ncbi:MAG: hypothetical protein QOF39_1234 [Frankiales bacterium]|nr:hypothetical protein [Frankiales bacterium]
MALGRPRVLVLRALGLGDLLTAVPALRGLRAALPDHELVLAAPSRLLPLVGLIGAVDRLLPAQGLEPLRWQLPGPDLAVNLHGRGPRSHRLLLDTGARALVAYASPELGYDGPPWQREHEVDRWCRLVEAAFGSPVPRDSLDLAVPAVASARPGAVVVHPGAAFPSRRWPAERFGAVCRALAERGHDVVVTGSAAEKPLVTEVVRTAGLPEGAGLAGRLDLAQLAALVASCRLLLCGDTGLAHLASAYGRPSVLLFGPVSPELWGPPKNRQHLVLWHGDGFGDPWGGAVDPALSLITPAEVVAAADRLLMPVG